MKTEAEIIEGMRNLVMEAAEQGMAMIVAVRTKPDKVSQFHCGLAIEIYGLCEHVKAEAIKNIYKYKKDERLKRKT